MSASLGFTNNARPPVMLPKISKPIPDPVIINTISISPRPRSSIISSLMMLLNVSTLIFVAIYGGFIIDDVYPVLRESTEVTYIRIQLISAVAVAGVTVLDTFFDRMLRRVSGLRSLLMNIDILLYTMMSVVVGFFLSSRYICPRIDPVHSGLSVSDICLRVENTSYILIAALVIRLLGTFSAWV